MWRMKFPDGKILREGMKNQWEALNSAFKEDGTRYKKAEALTVESGTTVYREYYHSITYRCTNTKPDGNLGDDYYRKTRIPKLYPFVLEEY